MTDHFSQAHHETKISAMNVTCPTCEATQSIELEHVLQCNLCGVQDEEFLFTRSDLALGLGGEFSVVRCRNCGLIYLNPRPTIRSISYYYPSAYECFNLPDVDSSKTRWARWSRSRHLNLRCKHVVKYATHGRLLDVGCSDGRFLHQMREYGQWERYGIELINETANIGRQRYGLTIWTGFLEEIELPPGSFDVITMWDVLEHVHNPAEALNKSAQLLRPGGLLIFSVPILDSIGGQIFGKFWVGYETPRHLHMFSRDTLHRYLNRTGFVALDETVLYGSNYAFADSVRFWLRGHNAPHTIYGGAHWLLRSRPWRFITAPIFTILDRLKLTTPITVVCKRL